LASSLKLIKSNELTRKSWFCKNLKIALLGTIVLATSVQVLDVALSAYASPHPSWGLIFILFFFVASSIVASLASFIIWPLALYDLINAYSLGLDSKSPFLCGGGAGNGGLGVYVDYLSLVNFYQPGFVSGMAFTLLMPIWLSRRESRFAPVHKSFWVICGIATCAMTLINHFYLQFAIYLAGGVCAGG
jgi:hypothetical protein